MITTDLVLLSGAILCSAQSLYCSTGDGDIIEYTWLGTSSGSIIRNVGPTKDDGLPTAKQGYVHSMAGSTRWLFYLTVDTHLPKMQPFCL